MFLHFVLKPNSCCVECMYIQYMFTNGFVLYIVPVCVCDVKMNLLFCLRLSLGGGQDRERKTETAMG